MSRFCLILLFLASQIFAGAVEDIISLKEMGLDDSSIVESASQGEKLKPADLIKLKKAGFSNELIGKLMKAQKASSSKQSQPTTIIVQQQESKSSGEVELTVHTVINGGLLKINGKEIARTNRGINKITVPTGDHVVRLETSYGSYEEEISVKSGVANVIHIYDYVEPPESCKEVYKSYIKKFERELNSMIKSSHKIDLVDREGFRVGSEKYEGIRVDIGSSIRIFDEHQTCVTFSGQETTYDKYGDATSRKNPEVLFRIWIDPEFDLKTKAIFVERTFKNFQRIVKEYRDLDESLARIEKFKASNPEPTLAIVYSDKAKKKPTESFSLSIPLAGKLYDITKEGAYAVCPLPGVPFTYNWKRKGFDKSSSFDFPEGKKVIIAVDVNWMGNQTKVRYVSSDVDLSQVNFSNHKKF